MQKIKKLINFQQHKVPEYNNNSIDDVTTQDFNEWVIPIEIIKNAN